MINSVALTVLIVLIVSISLVYYLSDSFYLETGSDRNSFYEKQFAKNEKHVFIVGGSQVYTNMTYINSHFLELSRQNIGNLDITDPKIISKNNKITDIGETTIIDPTTVTGATGDFGMAVATTDYLMKKINVYNLAISADRPIKRINSIEDMISARPDLVIYGLGYRDFSKSASIGAENAIAEFKKNQGLPKPEYYFGKFIRDNFNVHQNPKLYSMNILSGIISSPEALPNEIKNVPQTTSFKKDIPRNYFEFARFPTWILHIYSNEELEIKKMNWKSVTTMVQSNSESLEANKSAVIEMIQKLKHANIDVVIMSVPNPASFWKLVDDDDKSIFVSTLKEISSKTNTPVYFLHDKYSKSPIWADYTHITLFEEGLVYANDMIRIIKENVI